jgi:hypothetical protein
VNLIDNVILGVLIVMLAVAGSCGLSSSHAPEVAETHIAD